MLFLPIQVALFIAVCLSGSTSALPANSGAEPTNARYEEGKNLTTKLRGYDIPIQRRLVERTRLRRRGTLSGDSGLGDNSDL